MVSKLLYIPDFMFNSLHTGLGTKKALPGMQGLKLPTGNSWSSSVSLLPLVCDLSRTGDSMCLSPTYLKWYQEDSKFIITFLASKLHALPSNKKNKYQRISIYLYILLGHDIPIKGSWISLQTIKNYNTYT